MARNVSSFQSRKTKILEQLAEPQHTYVDLSPKGSVDVQIRDLIDQINAIGGLVTTSSCAGRVTLYLDGSGTSNPSEIRESASDQPGDYDTLLDVRENSKGNGGRWLFVSHDLLDEPSVHSLKNSIFTDRPIAGEGCDRDTSSDTGAERYIHFKFEPMILHILADSMGNAHKALVAAQTAGFRESGIIGLRAHNDSAPVMLALRATGLAFDNVVGCLHSGAGILQPLVTEAYLDILIGLANKKFATNYQRRVRFQTSLTARFSAIEFEDKSVRAVRKRAEGLQRQAMLAGQSSNGFTNH